MKRGLLGLAIMAAMLAAAPDQAGAQQTIIDTWPDIKAPPAPALKPVTVDPATTALLMLDFVKQACERRPRCVASLPVAKQLLAEARAKNMLVVYSFVSGGTMADTMPEVAPVGKEPAVQSGPDKFVGTDLEKILREHGIKTVIVAGTAANGAVLHTSDEAVFRGFSAVVPVDTMSADSPFIEEYVAYDLTVAPRVATATTLTRVGLIKF